jgi:hypothetical protein
MAATATCPHGFPANECLICRTLPAPQGGDTRLSPPKSGPPAPRRSIGLHLTGVVVGIALIGIIAWVVAGAVFALLHLLEIVLVAAAAGWAGYRLGHFRGRRSTQ